MLMRLSHFSFPSPIIFSKPHPKYFENIEFSLNGRREKEGHKYQVFQNNAIDVYILCSYRRIIDCIKIVKFILHV
jgi:hypothetical protein